jgi:hypothetical protein
MALKQIVFVICFVLGISLILFHRQIIGMFSSSGEQRVVLAEVSRVDGAAEVKNTNQSSTSAQVGTFLHDQDTLSVSGGTPLRLKFNDGLEVELEAGSVAFFENSDRGIFVNLRTGNFKGIAKGAGREKVLFVKDGAVLDPLGRNIMQPPLKIEEPVQQAQIDKPKPVEQTISEETLTDTQIGNSMSNLRQPLLKCYAGNLKADSKSKGEVYMSFTIERTGQVGLVKVLQDSFKDSQMTKCVTDVVARARFDSFKGDPIVVNYPIFFE